MKAKIIETGEIVTIVSDKFSMGCITVLHEDGGFSNVYSGEIELIDEWESGPKQETDWEKVKIDTAIRVASGMIANRQYYNMLWCEIAKSSVQFADALVEELKKSLS